MTQFGQFSSGPLIAKCAPVFVSFASSRAIGIIEMHKSILYLVEKCVSRISRVPKVRLTNTAERRIEGSHADAEG